MVVHGDRDIEDVPMSQLFNVISLHIIYSACLYNIDGHYDNVVSLPFP